MKKLIFFILPLWLLAEAHIFVLHRINDPRHSYTNTSTKELGYYLSYVKNHGYKAVKLSTLAKRMEKKQNINKYVVFTIDDSFKSFYKNGLPLFIKYRVPFTLFVYTQATTRHWGDFMSWKQVKNCAKYGELGVHSWAHPHLPLLTKQQIENDTEKAIDAFKKYTGYVPDMYAYPYGEFNSSIKKTMKKYFKIIANQNPGAIDLTTPVDNLDRIALTGRVNIAKKLRLKRLHIKNLKIKRNKNRIIQVSADIIDKVPYVNFYLTTFGWKYHVPVKNGFFHFNPHFMLKKFRNRIIIRYNYKIISKMIFKEK